MPESLLNKSLFKKKETLVQGFSCEFYEIFKNTVFIEHLQWLLLSKAAVRSLLLKSWPEKFCKIHRIMHMAKYLFNKDAECRRRG